MSAPGARDQPRTARGRGPIFLIGAMGSGTTLLRLMLDSHPNIAIPQETGFMRAYNAHRFVPFKVAGRHFGQRLGYSRKEFDQELATFYEKLFMRYVAEHGKQRWGEKTPLHTWHIDDMRRVFPEAAFVGILRHPGGSVASNFKRFPDPFERYVLHYTRYTREIIRQAAHYPRRFAVLRYEDLVLEPETTMRELLRWLGEPWSDQVLAHHVIQPGRSAKMVVEGRTRVEDPIDVSRISKWTAELDDEQRARVRQAHGELAAFLGYDVDDPTVIEPLNERGAPVSDGVDMQARVDRFPQLDLLTQGPVPRNEQYYDPRVWALVPAPAQGQPLPGTATTPPGPARRTASAVLRRLPPAARRRILDILR